MKQISLIIFALLLFSCNLTPQTPEPELDNPKNTIQLSILLDVSGSMEGLIAQAQTELWGVVNEVAKAKKDGFPSSIQIGLYSYGMADRNSENGFIRKLIDFTGDVDTISKVLFSLKTSGSAEYCGQVISKAQAELTWLPVDSVYKVIFIAGNEEFTQGPINYVTACTNANENNIFINTIHCGDETTGRNQHWADAARIGKGEYFWINANRVQAFVPSPYDDIIDKYNDSLNDTYWGYGNGGSNYKSMQMSGDAVNKSANKKAYYERVKNKTKKHVYEKNTAKWDLTSKVQTDTAILKELKDEQLPEQLKGKSQSEKKEIIVVNQLARDSFTKKIEYFSNLRDTFVSEERTKKPILNQELSLGEAISAAIRRQAGMKGFVF